MASLRGRGFVAVILLSMAGAAGAHATQDSSETPYAASRLIGRWRTIMNQTLEDRRASAAEEVSDLMEEFISPGAVRAAKFRVLSRLRQELGGLLE